MLAHGVLFCENLFNMERIQAIVKDFCNAGLSEEVALMAFAQKIIKHPSRVMQKDVEELHGFGLSDDETLILSQQ
jgi:uncharacterized protein YciW